MPTILPTQPLFVVECGPCAGVYYSREAYEEHLKNQGISYPETKSIFELNPWLDEGVSG